MRTVTEKLSTLLPSDNTLKSKSSPRAPVKNQFKACRIADLPEPLAPTSAVNGSRATSRSSMDLKFCTRTDLTLMAASRTKTGEFPSYCQFPAKETTEHSGGGNLKF